jgi:hypothetical protein
LLLRRTTTQDSSSPMLLRMFHLASVLRIFWWIILFFCNSFWFLLTCYFTGTVIDNKICHPRNYDFYLCAHAGMIVSVHYPKIIL